MGGIEAGKAFVKFLLEDSAFKKSLRNVGQKMKDFGKIGMAATAPIVAGFTAVTAAFVKVGDELGDMSVRTGISAEALSELSYAAEQSGTSIQSVERAVKKMQVGLVNASNGTGSLFEAINTLGLSIEELRAMSPEQQFTKLANAIATVEDPTLRAALAQKAFGRAGTELLPLLSAGATGLDNFRKAAHDMGVTLTEEDVAAAQKLDDALKDLKFQFMAMAIQIGAAVAGPLTDFIHSMKGNLAAVIGFINENPRLVKTIAAISVGMLTAATATYALGTALTFISLHPAIVTLTALVATLTALNEIDNALGEQGADHGASGSWDLPTGPAGASPEMAAIAAQSAAMQEQIEAMLPTVQSVTMDQGAIDAMSDTLGRSMDRAAEGIEELVRIQNQTYTLLRNGSGGLLAGGD